MHIHTHTHSLTVVGVLSTRSSQICECRHVFAINWQPWCQMTSRKVRKHMIIKWEALKWNGIWYCWKCASSYESDASYVHYYTACLAVQQLHICACMHSIVTSQNVWLLQSMKVLFWTVWHKVGLHVIKANWAAQQSGATCTLWFNSDLWWAKLLSSCMINCLQIENSQQR